MADYSRNENRFPTRLTPGDDRLAEEKIAE